ncbi:MAG: S8 family serine peptidase [Anaerolineae bacterium]|nr:S8 family serine peptidase [Anaerolineae bacterium]
MKRSGILLSILAFAIALFALASTAQAQPPLQGGATPTPGIIIEPDNPTPTPTRPITRPTPNGGGIKGTPVVPPKFNPPPTLDELIAQFPDLQPYLDQIKDLTADQLDLADLYKRLIDIFNANGATGVAAFLKDSGLLEKLNIPLAYLDLLVVYDEGGVAAVEELANTRGYINDDNEIVGYLGIDDKANYDALKADLETRLGVTVYSYLPDTEEVEIGLSLDLLAQYQTPGSLLAYLVQVGTAPHVISFRGPAPDSQSLGPTLQGGGSVGATTMGADKWHAAGFTGKGMKVGILDMGFAGIKGLLGSELPNEVTANADLDELDAQDNNHGTACAAVVHGIAPDAEIVIAYFENGSDESFFAALDFLAAQKVDVVNYSVARLIGPRDGSSFSAQIAEEFMRVTGALWINSAGNYAQSHTAFEINPGNKGVHFFEEEQPFLPFMAFAPVTTVVLNWDGSWSGGEKSEYVFGIYDEQGNEIATAMEPRTGKKTHYPFQITSFESTPGTIYYMVVQRTRGTTNNVMDIFVTNAEVAPWAQVPTYTVTTPGDASAVLTVGATGLTDDVLEVYSSQGPTFDDRIKPDLVAPTNEVVAGYTDGFSGTSGAAPAAAGAAALVKNAFPDLTNAEIKAYLMSNVVDLGDSGEDVQFGTGRIALPPPEGVNPDEPIIGGGSSSSAAATITKITPKFNVKLKGVVGLTIAVSFELDGFKGKQVVVGVIFTDDKGKGLPAADEDFSVAGVVGVGQALTVKSNQTAFKDVTFFIPNSAFANIPDTLTRMQYIVVVLDPSDTTTPLAVSEPGVIKLSRK